MKPSSIALALVVCLAFTAPALAAKGGNGHGGDSSGQESGDGGGAGDSDGGSGGNGNDNGGGNGNDAGGNDRGRGNAYGRDKQDERPGNGNGAVTVTVVPNEQQAVEEAVKANKALSLEDITALVGDDTNGRILDLQLVRFRGVYLYDVTVLEQNGVLHKLYYDARSGQPVRTK